MLINSNTRQKKLDAVMLRPAFIRGWDSIRRGAAFDYDDPESIGYERGRQAAIITRQVLGYVPPLRQSLDLVRPIYINARLELWISGDNSGLKVAADSNGKFSPEKYAAEFIDTSAPSKLDSLFG
jgi:hypothetical protein